MAADYAIKSIILIDFIYVVDVCNCVAFRENSRFKGKRKMKKNLP